MSEGADQATSGLAAFIMLTILGVLFADRWRWWSSPDLIQWSARRWRPCWSRSSPLRQFPVALIVWIVFAIVYQQSNH
jgi:hypothetical protein